MEQLLQDLGHALRIFRQSPGFTATVVAALALGADARRVKRTVVRQGMVLVMIGVVAGLVAAFYTAHVLASWLFEVKPRDPAVFVAVPLVLALIALISVWVPAARASRVNPLDALRYE